jgi:GH25 family lysozyme M1 (1,4-beta-N-acetylmuramidase)
MGARVPRRLLVCAVGILCLFEAGTLPANATPRPRYRVPGIDVSAYQFGVDWRAVASEPVRFVILRATGGRSFVDPRYGRNLSSATRHGLAVGAYHWADPGERRFDARIEADHFVDVARNAAGDVLPVLDIEQTNGLGPKRLARWVRAWLERVHDRLGVRPMIYSSPTFWRSNMANTRWFADQGYPLWVAHWGTRAPDVPASNWGGRGWTFWQRTATSRVRGIRTEVDGDRFAHGRLVYGTIASLTVRQPREGTIEGDRIACGGGSAACVRLTDPDAEVTLLARPGADAAFVRWTGACEPAGAAPTCVVRVLGDTEVSAVFDANRSGGAGAGGASTAPTDAPPEPSVSLPALRPVRPDPAVLREEEGHGIRQAWARDHDRRALGRTYRWEHRRRATMSFAFSGGSVTVFTMSGAAMGRARVSVDGEPVGTFDGYARSFRGGTRHRFTGLGGGRHELTITVLGTKRPRAKGTRVAIDALRFDGRLRRDPTPIAATWGPVEDAAASGGRYVKSDNAGAAISLRFVGERLTLRALRGPKMGHAEILLDGRRVRTLDLYAPRHGYASIGIARNLREIRHVVRIEVLGTHRPASDGSVVAIDRWIVG